MSTSLKRLIFTGDAASHSAFLEGSSHRAYLLRPQWPCTCWGHQSAAYKFGVSEDMNSWLCRWMTAASHQWRRSQLELLAEAPVSTAQR